MDEAPIPLVGTQHKCSSGPLVLDVGRLNLVRNTLAIRLQV